MPLKFKIKNNLVKFNVQVGTLVVFYHNTKKCRISIALYKSLVRSIYNDKRNGLNIDIHDKTEQNKFTHHRKGEVYVVQQS